MVKKMNKTLFKSTLRENWIVLLAITLIIFMYGSISVSMYDPESIEALVSMMEFMPEGMIKAMGFDNLGGNLTEYLGGYLYGFIFILFPLIFTVIVANKMIAKHVDVGSMAYLLTTPISRVRIATTQAMFLVTGITLILVFNVGAIVLFAEAMIPGSLDIPGFLGINLVTYLVLIAVAGIGFFASCYFNDTRNSFAIGGGVPILFFVIKLISEISDNLDWLRFFTIYSFVDVNTVLGNSSYVAMSSIILVAISVGLYVGGITIFNKKSLAI